MLKDMPGRKGKHCARKYEGFLTPEEELDVDNLNISFTIINELIFEEIIVDPEDPEVDPEDSEEDDPLPQTNGTALPLIGLGILFTGIGILSKRRK